MKIIDLTHPFTDSMPTYPGDPVPCLKQIALIGEKGYSNHELKTTMHVGTHIDAPAHMVEGGKRIDELPLELFYGKGVVVDARGKRELDVAPLRDSRIEEGQIVLFCTGCSKRYRMPEYFTDFPVMTEELARELVKNKIQMVGFDTPSPDKAPFAVHKILLGEGVPIIENLTNLEDLLKMNAFEIEAFPLCIAADAAPARVIAKIK